MTKEKWNIEKEKVKKANIIEIEYQTGLSKGRINRPAPYCKIRIERPIIWWDKAIDRNEMLEQRYYHYKRIKSIKVIQWKTD